MYVYPYIHTHVYTYVYTIYVYILTYYTFIHTYLGMEDIGDLHHHVEACHLALRRSQHGLEETLLSQRAYTLNALDFKGQ